MLAKGAGGAGQQYRSLVRQVAHDVLAANDIHDLEKTPSSAIGDLFGMASSSFGYFQPMCF